MTLKPSAAEVDWMPGLFLIKLDIKKGLNIASVFTAQSCFSFDLGVYTLELLHVLFCFISLGVAVTRKGGK